MKRLLFLFVLLSSAAFGQIDKHAWFQKVDALGNYNILNQRTYWDTLAVAVPFLNVDRTTEFLGNGNTMSFGLSSNRFGVIDFNASTAMEFNSVGVMNANVSGQINFQGGADILFGTTANQNFALFNQNHTLDIGTGGFEFDNKSFSISGNTTIGSSTHTVALGTSGNTSITLPTSGTLATTTQVDAKVVDAINDGVTTSAPSQNAVFDALALKQAADANLTTLSTPGTALYKVQVNAAGTDYEFAPQLTNPATTNGDIIYYNGTAFDRLGIGSAGSFLRSNTIPEWSTLILPNSLTANNVLYGTSTNTVGSSANMTFTGSILTVTGTVSAIGRYTANVGSSPAAAGITLTASGTSTINNLVKSLQGSGTVTMRSNSADIINDVALGGGFTTGGVNQVINGVLLGQTFTTNHTGATIVGIDYNPSVGGSQSNTHYAALFRSGRVGIGTATPSDPLTVNGNVSLITAGSGLEVAEGSNATMGIATLSAGAVTVNTTKVTANSRIFLTGNVDGGTPGWVRVSARSAGTSFTITSSSGTDTSQVAWIIIEPN